MAAAVGDRADRAGVPADPAGFDEDRMPLVRESPAALALGALWVVVYLAMAWHQGTLLGRGLITGGISVGTTHVFGDQTPAAIARGEVWRALTSTFIHFGPLHLALNLLGFVLFGRMVEGWYGSGPFVAIYVLIGTVGNLLSAAAKLALGADPFRPSGGGSGVAVGLIALIAVAGWRSRSRFGQFVRAQMFFLLLLLGIMGFFYPSHDNTGHATGAAVGMLIGLWHPALLRAGRRLRRTLGVLGVLTLVVCAAAQVRAAQIEARRARDEARLQRIGATVLELARAQACYRELTRRGSAGPPIDRLTPRPLGPPRAALVASLQNAIRAIGSLGLVPPTGPPADALRRLSTLADRAADRPPTPGEYRAFELGLGAIVAPIEGEARAIEQRRPAVPAPRPLPAAAPKAGRS